jgi:hypothetical protein
MKYHVLNGWMFSYVTEKSIREVNEEINKKFSYIFFSVHLVLKF